MRLNIVITYERLTSNSKLEFLRTHRQTPISAPTFSQSNAIYISFSALKSFRGVERIRFHALRSRSKVQSNCPLFSCQIFCCAN